MQTKIVQSLFILICTVVAAALQDLWPAFGGAKPPFLLALVLHWAFAKSPREEDTDRRSEQPPLYAARWIPAALVAGACEDALSGFPSGCATGYFLLAGAAARFLRRYIHVLKPAALGFAALAVAAPLHELWLAVWGVAGEAPSFFLRFFAAALPAAPVGLVVFFLLPRLEEAAGFQGTDTFGRAA